MVLALPFRFRSSRNVQMLFAALGLMAVAVLISSFQRKPRAWRAADVPVTFWSWRNQTPSDADVRAAIEKTNARLLFLRAGQIDFQDGKLSRIRPVKGPLPKEIELHLVYNATRALLAQLESVDEKSLAETIAKTFQEDSARALSEDACVFGLQIDIDVPTRLLARYERILRALRGHLKPREQLSITGLPTWMQSSELRSTLTQVDFWIPQFYGAEIPARVDQLIPISSPPEIERFVNRARDLDKPFHAGLAAYSYALLYSSVGSLVSLRGDLDTTVIAADANLELVDARSFGSASAEWRYLYRARADGVTDGLAMHAGDLLVVDVPSVESLRTSARVARELGGEFLLGICVFRLPAADDAATLTIEQVATALADKPSSTDFRIKITNDRTRPGAALLEVNNAGTANAVGGFKFDVGIEAGTIAEVSTPHGASIETICRLVDGRNKLFDQPCSQNRANVIRLAAPGLRSGQTLKALLILNRKAQDSLPVSIETQTDDGQAFRKQQDVHFKME